MAKKAETKKKAANIEIDEITHNGYYIFSVTTPITLAIPVGVNIFKGPAPKNKKEIEEVVDEMKTLIDSHIAMKE